MSHHDSVLMFTNTSRTACQIQGYPGLAVLNAAGTQIKQAPRAGGPAPLVDLMAGDSASALIGDTSASCDKPASGAAAFLVTAPGQRASTRLAPRVYCLNSLEVSPVVAGTTGGTQ